MSHSLFLAVVNNGDFRSLHSPPQPCLCSRGAGSPWVTAGDMLSLVLGPRPDANTQIWTCGSVKMWSSASPTSFVNYTVSLSQGYVPFESCSVPIIMSLMFCLQIDSKQCHHQCYSLYFLHVAELSTHEVMSLTLCGSKMPKRMDQISSPGVCHCCTEPCRFSLLHLCTGVFSRFWCCSSNFNSCCCC